MSEDHTDPMSEDHATEHSLLQENEEKQQDNQQTQENQQNKTQEITSQHDDVKTIEYNS